MFFIVVFSHNQYYGYTVPRTSIIFALGNLGDNLEHNSITTSKHATFTVLNILVS